MQETIHREKQIERKKEEIERYQNPLFNNLSNKEFNQENFFLYKKDINDLLLFLLWEIKYLETHINKETIENKTQIEKRLTLSLKKQELLSEYCQCIKEQKNMPIPYQYLWTIAHNSQSIFSNIQNFIIIYHETTQEKKENIMKSIKKIIDVSKESIEDKINKLNTLEFAKNWFYIKKDFSPYKETEKTINNNKGEIQNKEIKINNMIANDLNIKSYKDIFWEVIENLINNAIKFTPKWWDIEIGIEYEDEKNIRFFVKDSWIGIPTDSKIFSQWYTTPSIEGKKWTGLGLTQSKIFIEISWGTLSYKQNIPQGTQFTFLLKKDNKEKDLQK